MEIDSAVDSLIGPFLLFGRPGADEPQRPPLELIWVGPRQSRGTCRVGWFADNFKFDRVAERAREPMLDKRHRQMRYVNSNPTAIQPLRNRNRGPAAAK